MDVCLSGWLAVCLFDWRSVCLAGGLSVCLAGGLSGWRSVCLAGWRSVCLAGCPSTWNYSASTGRISWNLIFDLFRKSVKKIEGELNFWNDQRVFYIYDNISLNSS
jgi:hypothetical protein